ncbi:MAG TPA: TIM barrel protein [Acidobacteriaceae bacterium]|nr:TIM barrel protein [Acidobacteriaceae bacterium]
MLWTLDHKTPFEQCLEMVASAGYQGLQLVNEYRGWSQQDIRRMKARMHSLGLVCDTMSGIHTGFADPHATNALLAEFNALIPIAKELECPQIILLSGPRVDGVSHDAQYKASINNLQRVADVAAKHNLRIVIEPIDPLENPIIWLTSVADGFRIVRAAAQPNLKVLYDFYHEQRAAGNLIEKLENNIDWVGLIHIADVPGRHEPGTGEIDYGNIYRKLAALQYDRIIAMEYYPTEDPVTSLRASRLYALQAVQTKARIR